MCKQFFCLSVWSFTFTEKSDCDKVNHVVSMISITTILVKLLQIIWCYVTAMCQSVWLFLCIFRRYAFLNIMVLSHTAHFKRGTWISNHYGELEKKIKSREYLNLRWMERAGAPKDTILGLLIFFYFSLISAIPKAFIYRSQKQVGFKHFP